MATRLLVFANCQSNPLASTLGVMSPDVEIIRCPPVHTIPAAKTDSVFDLLSQADMIVHQPIGQGFGPISSDAIKERFPEKHYASFPSVYYGGVFPQLRYLRRPGGGTLSGPLTDYHDMRILKSFLDDMPVEACVEKLENDGSDYQELVTAAKQESYAREVGVDVPVMKWVEEALQERPCFYTFNHPDNKLLWLIAEHLLQQLGLPISPDAKLRQKPFLGEVSAAVPRGIAQALGASWRRDLYAIDGEEIAWRDLIERFYALYASVADLRTIVDFNRKRSMIPLI